MFQKVFNIIFDGKIQFPIKFISFVSYYVIPLSLFVIISGYYIVGKDPYEFSVELGETALLLLLIILFIKPLSQIFVDIKLLTKILIIRRQLGVIMFWFFLAHGIGTFLHIGIVDYVSVIQEYKWESYYLWGSLGGGIIFLLGITSNNFAVRLLKKNWKYLHTLIYPALFFIVLHVYFIEKDFGPLIIFGIFCLLKILVKKGFYIKLRR